MARRKTKAIRKQEPSRGSKKAPIPTLPLYILLIILFISYIALQRIREFSFILGIAIFFLIIIIIGLELVNGTNEEGYKKSVFEIAVAIIVVVAIWFALQAILQTNNPVDVVPSCSMLPTLSRGDLIVLHGIQNISQIHAPIIGVSTALANNIASFSESSSLSCVAYNYSAGRLSISQIVKPGYIVGLYLSSQSGGEIVPYSAESSYPVRYRCGTREIKYANGTTAEEAYTNSISIANTTISGDKGNTIIVYRTLPEDQFYKEGDLYIVHRVYAILNASGQYYMLTKGDNNPGLDMQYFNVPPNQSEVSGYVVASVPYLGYIKLIISGDLSQPVGCNSTVIH